MYQGNSNQKRTMSSQCLEISGLLLQRGIPYNRLPYANTHKNVQKLIFPSKETKISMLFEMCWNTTVRKVFYNLDSAPDLERVRLNRVKHFFLFSFQNLTSPLMSFSHSGHITIPRDVFLSCGSKPLHSIAIHIPIIWKRAVVENENSRRMSVSQVRSQQLGHVQV